MDVMDGDDDWLSKLPDAIIQHILFFLSMKDAVRASTLSKFWLSAYKSNPSLEFYDACFSKAEEDTQNSESSVNYTNFQSFVNNTLERYVEQKMGIEKLSILTSLPDRYSASLVEEWVGIAALRGLEKLALMIKAIMMLSCSMTIPILEAKSLTELTIFGCNGLHLRVSGKILCHRLRKLRLYFVLMDDATIENIVRSCPLIDMLHLFHCGGVSKILVSNLLYLKELRLRLFENQLVEVDALNLQYLYYEGVTHKPLQLTLRESQSLKTLILRCARIPDEFFHEFRYKYPCLQSLEVYSCSGLTSLHISSPSLRVICLNYFSGLKDIVMDAPSIESFQYSNRGLIPSFIPSTYLESALDLVESTISLNGSNYNPLWFERLKELLNQLGKSRISLTVECKNQAFIENLVDVSSQLQTPEVESLVLNIKPLGNSLNLGLIDGLFWSCRPKQITICHSPRSKEFIQWLREKVTSKLNGGSQCTESAGRICFTAGWSMD